MSCCGQKRAALRTSSASASITAPPVRPRRSPDPPGTEVTLRYLGSRVLAVRGPHTGRVYHFAEHGSLTPVDPRDAEPLLRTALFTPT